MHESSISPVLQTDEGDTRAKRAARRAAMLVNPITPVTPVISPVLQMEEGTVDHLCKGPHPLSEETRARNLLMGGTVPAPEYRAPKWWR
jgi:hypothetical protein